VNGVLAPTQSSPGVPATFDCWLRLARQLGQAGHQPGPLSGAEGRIRQAGAPVGLGLDAFPLRPVRQAGVANDQFNQWPAVDPSDGSVNLSWNDTRNDPAHLSTDIFYARSACPSTRTSRSPPLPPTKHAAAPTSATSTATTRASLPWMARSMPSGPTGGPRWPPSTRKSSQPLLRSNNSGKTVGAGSAGAYRSRAAERDEAAIARWRQETLA